ncbi:rhodanese-like domain-containing protein [Shewanella sp. GXUN23E]|uniref:rhodanese-like domain-containing protein n=1 Tax=Shewanella sp. GXUN23E TaxID=3422498 RepID=UPI003D7E88EE
MQSIPPVEVELTSPATCRQWVGNQCQIIDVRGEAEFAMAHYPGACNIPLDQLADWARQITDKSTPRIFYCGKGIRAQMAINLLREQGFTQLANGGSLEQLKATLA